MKRRIDGPEDFVSILPSLFLADLTCGGTRSFKQSHIGVFPRGCDPEDARAIVFTGSRISFNFMSPDERARYGGIITNVEITEDSVYKNPNRKALREFLENPYPGKRRDGQEMFERGVLLGGEELRVLAPLKSYEMEGDVKPYWDSFHLQILKPIKRVLWPI